MTLEEDLRAQRATYPARLAPTDAVTLLNAFAWQYAALGLGLYRAPHGGNGATLPNGEYVRCDILASKDPEALRIYDVFIDGPDANGGPWMDEAGVVWPFHKGRAEVTWQDKGPIDLSRWVAPVDPTPGEIQPTPGTPPPVTDTERILGAIASVATEVAALRARVMALESPDWPAYRGEVTLPFLGTRSLVLQPEEADLP